MDALLTTSDIQKAGSNLLIKSESPFLDSQILLSFTLGASKETLLLNREKELAKSDIANFKALIDRRKSGEPIAYITGRKDFYKFSFKVNSSVLIPRPETEMIVESALTNKKNNKLRVLDLCTGSGCVAISIALEKPEWKIIGADISNDALVVAKENRQNLNATNISFIQSDLFENIEGKFDLILANPPYVDIADKNNLDASVVDYEPHIALFEKDGGLNLIKKIIKTAPAHLNDGGQFLCEFGIGQKDTIENELQNSDFKNYSFKNDIANIPRIFNAVI